MFGRSGGGELGCRELRHCERYKVHVGSHWRARDTRRRHTTLTSWSRNRVRRASPFASASASLAPSYHPVRCNGSAPAAVQRQRQSCLDAAASSPSEKVYLSASELATVPSILSLAASSAPAQPLRGGETWASTRSGEARGNLVEISKISRRISRRWLSSSEASRRAQRLHHERRCFDKLPLLLQPFHLRHDARDRDGGRAWQICRCRRRRCRRRRRPLCCRHPRSVCHARRTSGGAAPRAAPLAISADLGCQIHLVIWRRRLGAVSGSEAQLCDG